MFMVEPQRAARGRCASGRLAVHGRAQETRRASRARRTGNLYDLHVPARGRAEFRCRKKLRPPFAVTAERTRGDRQACDGGQRLQGTVRDRGVQSPNVAPAFRAAVRRSDPWCR